MDVKALRKAMEFLPDDQPVMVLTTERAFSLIDASESLYVPLSDFYGDVYCTPEEQDAKIASRASGWADPAPEGAVRIFLLEPMSG
jgi:hypothetical protein